MLHLPRIYLTTEPIKINLNKKSTITYPFRMIVSANVIRLGIQFTFPGSLLHEIGVFYDFQKETKKKLHTKLGKFQSSST